MQPDSKSNNQKLYGLASECFDPLTGASLGLQVLDGPLMKIGEARTRQDFLSKVSESSKVHVVNVDTFNQKVYRSKYTGAYVEG